MKGELGQGREARIHFLRTSTGSEVDFLVERGDRLIPIEVQASSTPRPAMTAGIQAIDMFTPGLNGKHLFVPTIKILLCI